MDRLVRLAALALVAALFAACGPSLLETGDIGDPMHFVIAEDAQIPDTDENRAILEAVSTYRDAIARLDTQAVSELVGPGYFENASTTDDPSDDYGNEAIPVLLDDYVATNVDEIRYDMKIRRLVRERDTAHIDYEFRWDFRFTLAGRTYWRSAHDVNRISMVLNDGKWQAIGGL